MNKSEFVAAVADASGSSKAEAERVVDAAMGVIAGEMTKGNKVQLPGWLTFEKRIRAARKGRNPQTGAEVNIPATPYVKVGVGSKLKAAAKA